MGDEMEKQLRLYLMKICEHGGVVTASIAIAAARGIVLSKDHSKLVEFGGYIDFSRQWVLPFSEPNEICMQKSNDIKNANLIHLCLQQQRKHPYIT